MIPELKERFLETAEEDGWLRDRDIEKAKKMLKLDIPAEKIAEAMGLPLDMVRTLV